MSITLKWTNPATLDEVQVYRFDTPLAAGTLPTGSALAVITDKSQSYTDESAVQNKLYYYTLAYKTGNDVVYAPQSVAINMPYTGPGPTTIQTGTWERGFFGLVQASDMPSNPEFQAILGSGVTNSNNAGWLKFIWKGKVMFAPLYRVLANISWNQLYLAGCVYGVTGPGPATGHGLTATDQRRVITKGEHDFVVRMPRCQSTADYSWAGVLRDTDSEWINMICSLFNQNSAGPAFDMADYLASTYFDATSTIFAEFVGANAAYTSGTNPTAVNAPNGSAGVRATANCSWRPVLELII